jgi:hypothetical protein
MAHVVVAGEMRLPSSSWSSSWSVGEEEEDEADEEGGSTSWRKEGELNPL